MIKKIITMILVFSMILSSMISVFAESSFSDMPKSDYWSFKALNEAVNNGLIHGYNGKINPKNNVTRAQLATVINNAFGAKEAADISMYKDVPSNAWYAKQMAMAVNMGTVKGVSSNKLEPLSYVTRQEAFCIIANALKLSDGDAQNLNKFSDKDKIASWATNSIASLVQAGYIIGYGGGKLNPNGNITLEELAQVMSNIIQQYFSVSGEYTQVNQGNVMINTENVTLKNTKINGDLIIGEGAANSDITLDKVTISGRLVVRGGGQNSIKIINYSNVGSIIVGKSASGAIRIKIEEGCKVGVVYIDDGKDDVIVEGVFNQVVVKSDTPVVVKDAEINVLSVAAESANVKIKGKSIVQITEIQENATNSKIEVTKDATVKKVNSAADNVVIGGDGSVVEANISGDNTQVNTDNTDLVVEKGTTGVIENGNAVKDTGEPIKTGEPKPEPSSSGTGGTGTGGTGTGGSGTGDTGEKTDTIKVTSEDKLIEAMNSDSIKNVKITENIVLTNNLTINKHVEIVAGKELTNYATISLNNCALRVYGKFTNNGNVDVREGRIYRMVDLKPTDTGINVVQATIDSTSSLSVCDVAIAHNFEGLKKAAVTDKAIYERIEIMRHEEKNDSDIVLESDLDIDADMYIERGCGIEVPENYTLNIVGNNHNIDNEGDIWVYGKLNLGSNNEFYNDGKIQVGGIYGILTDKCTFTNNGTMENRNYIEVLSNGLFTNNGNISNRGTIKVQDGEFNGSGIVVTKVYDYEQLTSAMGNSSITNIVIASSVALKGNLSVDKPISIGYDRELGDIKTNGYTITIPTNQTLSVNAGQLVINKNLENSGLNGKVINNGTLVVSENGRIRIEEGGALETANDIDIIGWLDVYNYEGMNSYITGAGKITTYSDRAGLIDRTLDILYEFNDQEVSITPSDIAVNAGASITPTADIVSKVSEVSEWFNDYNTLRHYAYASMMLNGIGVTSVSDLDTPENNPYTKVTYGYAKTIFQQVANKLGLGAEQSVVDFMSTLDSKDSTAYIDDVGQDSSIDKLFNDFSTALCQATGKMIVWDYSQLMSAINDNYITDIMISGNIELNENLSVDKSISIGSYRNGGELKTNGYTITIPMGNILNINEGNLVINKNNENSGLNGKVINNGTLVVSENGRIRIEEGGALETANDIDIRGNLDVYDYDNMSTYITGTGKITTYSDRAGLIDRTLDILYEFNDEDQVVSVSPSAISISAGASITPTADIQSKVSEVRDWFIGDGRNDNYTRRHYAYASMMLNGIGVTSVSDLDTPENNPYAKVTYGYAKAIFEQVANKLGLGEDTSVKTFMTTLGSKDSTAYIDDFGQINSMNTLFDDFWAALNQAIEAIKD